jgi:hypothetical protein
MGKKLIAVDLARVYENQTARKPFMVLTWGDEVEVVESDAKKIKVKVTATKSDDGSAVGVAKNGVIKLDEYKVKEVLADVGTLNILKINFVDVQQGDGAIIETPGGQVVLVDGGENKLFSRYLAARFRGTTEAYPRDVAAIVVSHGDADHFAGLTLIHDSETHPDVAKRVFINPQRIFHNGIFKRPDKDAYGKDRKEKELLNDTVTSGGQTYLQPLVEAVSSVKAEFLNKPFKDWVDAIKAWRKRAKAANKKVEEKRLQLGDHAAFDFLRTEGIDVQVLGPVTDTVKNNPGLPFLGKPPKGPKIGHDAVTSLEDKEFGGASASHTINGHSIVLRLTYGGFAFLLTGDLNDQSERALVRKHNAGTLNLRADVLKAPHHGSADFSAAFLKAVGASVSVISSGDENERLEYIHPRASLVGALGKYSRADEPLVLCTELAAFFKTVGYAAKDSDQDNGNIATFTPDAAAGRFFAHQRTSFGMIKTRCDGKRLLVTTNSGRDDMKEAYAFDLNAVGEPQPAVVRQT